MKKPFCHNLPPPQKLSHPHIGNIPRTEGTPPGNRDDRTVRMEETRSEKEKLPVTAESTSGEQGETPIQGQVTRETDKKNEPSK